MGRPLRDVGNEGNQNKIGSFNQSVLMGSAVKNGGQTVSAAVATNVLVLDENSKASGVISAFATAGTATGEKLPVIGTPAAGQVAVDLNGNILFNGTDAVTAAEVVFVPVEGSIVDAASQVASGAITLPNSDSARLLLTATVDGNSRTVVARGATPGVGEATIDDLGLTINFNAADDDLLAVVRYIQLPTQSVLERLNGEVEF